MKKKKTKLRLETFLRDIKRTTQVAAARAISEGRTVTSLENGKIVLYGPGACTFDQKKPI